MITAAILICLSPIAYDGDTFRCGASQGRVRLFLIKAPEINPLQPGAVEAKTAAQGHSNGGLICNPRGASYNRTVATCSNSAGKDIGRLLLDAGLVTEDCPRSVSRAYPRGFYGTCSATP